jgi:hypothetical protein
MKHTQVFELFSHFSDGCTFVESDVHADDLVIANSACFGEDILKAFYLGSS